MVSKKHGHSSIAIATHLNTLQVVVCGIVAVQEVTSNVWDILTSITLASDVNLVALHAKGINEILPECGKLISNINFIVNKDISGWVSSADGLIDPDHIGQVGPWIWIWDRCICARLPTKRSIFLKQSIKGGASWLETYLVMSLRVGEEGLGYINLHRHLTILWSPFPPKGFQMGRTKTTIDSCR